MDSLLGVPKDELIVSVVVHDNVFIVATNKNVYTKGDDGVMRKAIFQKERVRVCSGCNGSGMFEAGKVSRTCFKCLGTGIIK